MKVMTIVGTRPEIIRLSLIIKKLDQLAAQHVLVHTGQNFSKELKDVFFEEMGIRQPDYMLGKGHTTLGKQLGEMYSSLEEIIEQEQPDRALLLGDTNSALTAILLERLGIPVFHMEAGNRCFDKRVPEEKNRTLIDTASTYNLPYTKTSKQHLLREGIAPNRIMVTGNPIYEVLMAYDTSIRERAVLENLQLKPKNYFLATFHRAECVDDPVKLTEIVTALQDIAAEYQLPVVCSIHPRTRQKLSVLGVSSHPLVQYHKPFGFFDFVHLEQHAACVLTDSGTVQEECCIFHIPAVTMRNTTERPETLECGSNILSGIHSASIVDAVRVMMACDTKWNCPIEYLDPDVSSKVVKLLMRGDYHEG
ncbi:non-hydrolyzing UDP-N-acetylglucosamine 2-epimerase [Pontibacillus salicampi]|uniref:Non-hydrolyzing UDP-N-acetylglucosamine 2-epimerase n=1 Tax=Pontibacillus salicampi TaxID=1449801 RepID=A0ABV6LSF7_9BACI